MKYSIRDLTPYALDMLIKSVRQSLDTAISRMYFLWWGIKLGRSAHFLGVPIMHRHPTGTIIIGNNATFRSAEWSNSIGLNRRCYISAGRDALIKIGEQCGFSGTIIAASQSITIGNRVLCGANCTIVDTNRHPIGPIARANKEKTDGSPVVIEDDVFLGMNVVVLKGCTIGIGTVVAANSVVASSLPAGVIAGGVPARVLSELKK